MQLKKGAVSPEYNAQIGMSDTFFANDSSAALNVEREALNIYRILYFVYFVACLPGVIVVFVKYFVLVFLIGIESIQIVYFDKPGLAQGQFCGCQDRFQQFERIGIRKLFQTFHCFRIKRLLVNACKTQ